MPSRYKRPVTAAARERREQASADKLAALHDRLAEQVAALRTGEDWRRWLDVAHRFHTYSFNNTLLIFAQRPEATAVAGFEAWKALGRQVDKGERGIQVLAPVVRRLRKDEASEDSAPADRSDPNSTRHAGTVPSDAETFTGEDRRARVTGYRVTYVWDVSQTSGTPLPEQPRPQLLSGQAPPGLWDSLTRLMIDRGFHVERGDCGPANGWTNYTNRTVRVRDDVDDAQATKTLAHEAGHVLLHDPTSLGESTTAHCRGTQEVEAESVAYLVTATHGLRTDDYTFAYVTGWAGSLDSAEPERVVRDTGQRVLTATRAVLAVTAPDGTLTADPSLAARAQAGTERTAAARRHADATYALAVSSSGPVIAPAQLDALARLHAEATVFYAAQLAGPTPDAARARSILWQRAVPPPVAAAYEIGYAPAGWTALTDHLRGRGYTDEQLLAAGVSLTTRRGTVVDRFRDRLMLPVRGPAGERVVAFIGRTLGQRDGTPKYLNSPETALYRKGDVLYGLGAEPVRRALAGGAQPVLVEGALDAIAVTCAGAGRYAGVAPSGTALTAAQVAALDVDVGSLAERPVTVAFDSDGPGQQAALRSYPLLRAVGAWPTTAALPDGQDPASLAQEQGAHALAAALDNAEPLADLVVDERLARWAEHLRWAEGRVGAAREVSTLIAAMPAQHVARQVARVAAHTGLHPSTVTGEVAEAVTRGADASDDAWGRQARLERRHDLDRDPAATAVPTAVQLARAGYPAASRGRAAAPRPSSTDPSSTSLDAPQCRRR